MHKAAVGKLHAMHSVNPTTEAHVYVQRHPCSNKLEASLFTLIAVLLLLLNVHCIIQRRLIVAVLATCTCSSVPALQAIDIEPAVQQM